MSKTNTDYHFARMQELLDDFVQSRERSLAATKLEECQMWLTKCKPTDDAVYRDLKAPVFGASPAEAVPIQSAEIVRRAAAALMEHNASENDAENTIKVLNNAGIYLRSGA
jgi:site-specific recombinase